MVKEYSQIKVVLATYGIPGAMAIESLFALGLSPHQISILTHPADSRNQILWDLAEENEIEITALSAKSNAASDWVLHKHPDVLFSIHYRYRISKEILEIPTMGCVNLHPALLPNYRGCFSSVWAIINGEKQTGYTYHYMTEKFDAGNILLQKKIPLTMEDTAFSLFHKLIVEGLGSFREVFEMVVKFQDAGMAQPKEGSYYPRKLPFGGKIDNRWDEATIERFIRAMHFPPHKGAIIHVNGKECEIRSLTQYRIFKKRPGLPCTELKS
jgi:methionyl-tRNA formyltransferase